MKHLLIPSDGFLPRWDGVASFLDELIPRISHKFRITVLAPNLGELKRNYKINLVRFPTLGVRLGDNYRPALVNPFVVAKYVKRADIVWAQVLGPIGMWGMIFAKLYKKKLLYYNHLFEWEVFPKSQKHDMVKIPIYVMTKLVGKIFYNMCDVILVSSRENADMLSLMGIRPEKKVVHLGVDVNHYSPEDKKTAKKKLNISPEFFVVGYGGRLSYEKNLHTLYRAFHMLVKKRRNVLLLIAGGGHPSIERLFRGKENIIFTGFKDDLAPYYRAMDVYVLPSLVETTSLTTMEAMACGTPVVVTPVGFVKEYVNDGVNGFFFPKKNSYALFKKLEFLMDNEELREKIGRNARKTIVDNFTWDITAQKIMEILDSL